MGRRIHETNEICQAADCVETVGPMARTRQNATIASVTATATAAGNSPTVSQSTPIWRRWLTIAVATERDAEIARFQIEESQRAGRLPALEEELQPAMLAITASSHAVDGFYGAFRNSIDAMTRASWQQNGTARYKQVFETLKRAAKLDQSVRTDLKWLFDLRDAAVHHYERPRGTAMHPSTVLKTAVSQEYADYCIENARRAVSIALTTAEACVDRGPLRQAQRVAWREFLDGVQKARWS